MSDDSVLLARVRELELREVGLEAALTGTQRMLQECLVELRAARGEITPEDRERHLGYIRNAHERRIPRGSSTT